MALTMTRREAAMIIAGPRKRLLASTGSSTGRIDSFGPCSLPGLEIEAVGSLDG